VVPELLWSPVGNFVYQWFQDSNHVIPYRDNFLMQSNNINWFSTIVFIQLLGIFLTFVYLIIINKNIKNRWGFWSSLLFTFLLSVIVFLSFGLSISLRNIGF